MVDKFATYGLGLEQDSNRPVASNALWPRAFAEETARIRVAVGENALAIEHYGSTAAPDLPPKPIIDLLVSVADIAHGLLFVAPMATLGYDYASDQGIPEHHIFGKGCARTHLGHVVLDGGEQWSRALRFRDILRSDVDLRHAYEALKVNLAAAFPIHQVSAEWNQLQASNRQVM